MPSRSLLALLLATACTVAACGGDDDPRPLGASEGEPLRVAAAFYPLEEAARAIAGTRARVTGLTPPGEGPHDLELKAPQLRALEDAGLVLFLGAGFQPEVEKAVSSLGADTERADLLDAVRLRRVDAPVPGVRGEVDGEKIKGDRDPHVWVDPRLFGRLVDAALAAFVRADPDGREVYERNARAYRAKVDALDREFAGSLGECATRTLVTSHAAFGYLADRYDLEQAPIAGISPDDEPDPRSLAATARRAKADGVRTVFFETLVPRRLSDTVAREIGARSDALNPVEGLTRPEREAGANYLTVQRDNLARLKRGLQCTA